MNKVRGTLVLIFLLVGIGLNAQTFNNPGGTQNTCSGTFFDSGGSTGNYANSENITTTFCSDNGGTIIINFTAFSLELGFDDLEIFDGPTTASTPVPGSPFSGTVSPGTVSSTGTCLTFRFTSDGSVTDAGWSASISCAAAVTEYPNPGGTLNICSGNFSDTGGLAGNYGNSENITTTICSDNGDPLNVAFTSFDTEAGFDELFVFNGADVTATPYPGSPFSGTTLPGPIVSSGTCLTFQFISDGSVTGGGWTTSISCGSVPVTIDNPGGTVVACNGNFFDSGGLLGTYGNNENIETTICPSTVGECLTVDFTTFDLESPFDDLTIYDGTGTGGTNLGTFTGTLSPGSVSATTDCLTFVFSSDASVQNAGWAATLSCNTCGVTVCSGSTPTCSPAIPDACTDACDLGTLGTPAACPTGGSTSNVFCLDNVGATAEDPYSTLIGCEDGGNMASPAADVWYSFVATANITTINIDGLTNPSLGVYEGSTCTTMIGRGCDNGAGSLSLEINPTNPGVTYFLQISGGDETDVGDFELEVISTWDCTNCLNSSILTATPPPVNGQYQPGQVVEFCFTVNSWNTTANNWIHSVVPIPGGGWIPGSLTPTTIPPSCDANGDWGWYNTITGTNANSINPGTVGPGFSFDAANSGGPAFLDGIPGNNFGDQGSPAECPFGVTWTYCWTVEVADIANVGDCLANTPEYDLKMTVQTYGDGETGSWTVESCVDDPVTESFTTTACCLPPNFVIDDTPCAGESTGAATVTGDGVGPFDYAWVDNTNTTFQTATGVAGGNQATGLAAGTYTVSVTDTDNGCVRTATVVIVADTSPSVAVSPTSVDICQGASTTLTATGSSGSGSGYTYVWEQPDATTLSTAAITASQIGTYTVTVTDSGGCTSTEEATVGLFPAFTVTVTTTETSGSAADDGILCAGDFATLDAGTYVSYVWSSDPSDTNQTLSVSTPGTYTVTVTDTNGCTGTGEATISNTALPTPTITITETSGSTDNDGTICSGDDAILDAGTFVSYLWSDAGASVTQTITVNTGGDYTVTVTDANGCQGTTMVTITVDPLPIPVITATETSGTTNDDGIICTGDAALLDAGIFTSYLWSDALATTTQTLSVDAGGTYTVSVTDGNGCVGTAEFIVTENPAPTPVMTVTETSGLANDDGIICDGDAAVLDPGTFDTYLWSDAGASTTPTLTVMTAGDYTVTVTDANGCQATATTTIVVNPAAAPTITVTETSGNTDDDGIICTGDDAVLDAGVFTSYVWSTGEVTQMITVNTADDYTVTVTDGNGCQGTGMITITVNPLPTATITVAETSGTTDNDGIICTGDDAILDAGVHTSYLWSDAAASTTQTISVNVGGDYTVTVADANGCESFTTISIIENPLPTPTIAISETSGAANDDGILCDGDAAILDAGTFVSYLWSDAAASTTQTISVMVAGDYTVTVVDANGCENTAMVTISTTPLPSPVITAIETSGTTDNDGIICSGDDAILDAGVFTSYVWSTGDITQTTTVNAAGDYTVTVTDSDGCQGTGMITITVNPLPTPIIAVTETSGIANDDGIICAGDAVTLDVGIFASYLWSDAAASTTQNITVNAGGDYTVTVTDVNGCEAATTITIIENPLPTPTITISETSGTTNDDGILCDGDAATLDAGTFDSYLWSDAAASTTQTISVMVAGDYTVTVVDANGCANTAMVTITTIPLPTPSIGISETSGTTDNDGVICIGDDAILDAGTFAAYVWSTGEITQTITVNTADDYSVTVTDADGCQGTDMVTIVVNPLPAPAITVTETSGIINDDGIICTGDMATLDAGTFDSYLWSDAAASTTQTIMVGTGGDYTVTVTDANGCQESATITITENPLPTPTIDISETSGTTNDDGILCDGDAATLDAGIFDSYLWSDAAASTTQTISVTAAGDYTVTVIDANGCANTATVTISTTPLPNPSITVSETSGTTDDDGIICTGDDAILDAGTFASYAWSTGEVTQMITVNTGGDYTVTVTDMNGCQGTDVITIIVNPLPVPMIAVTETSGTTNDDGVICTGDAAILDAGVFISYLWSDAAASTTQTISVTAGGDYTVTVVDANGCEASAMITITENPVPTPIIATIETSGTTDDDGIICAGDNVLLDPGTFDSYLWSDAAASTTQTITVTAAGDYTVTVTDANGCIGTGMVTITELPLPTPIIVVSETSGIADDDGILCDGDAAVLDAGAFTSYAWSTGETTQTITVTTAGDYTVTVTDVDGCSGVDVITIDVNPLPIPTITVAETSGTTDDDGIICVGDPTVLDAGAYISYLWSDAAASTTQTITVNAGGDYTVTVVDANGCEGTATITIIENPLPTPAIVISETSGITADDGILCDGDAATLDAGNYASYLWSDAAASTTQTITVNIAGDYTVTVTDANGCQGISTVTISTTPLPVPVIAVSETSGLVDNDGILCAGDDAVLDAGVYASYLWSTGETTQTITVAIAGDYTVTVIDANGCQGSGMTTITVNPVPTPTVTFIETSGVADNDGIICQGDMATLDAGAFDSYLWSTGEMTQTIDVSDDLDYTVTVTDANGCEASVIANVTVTPLPTPSITVVETSGVANDDGIICDGDMATLNAGSFATYAWSTGESTQTIDVTTSETFTVTVTDVNGCVAEDMITITVTPLPTPVIAVTETSGSTDNDGILCQGDVATLDPGTYDSYLWSDVAASTTQTLDVTAAGTYTVTVTDANGCQATSETTITVNPLPIPAITVAETSGVTDDDGILCDGDDATLDAGAGFASYLWSDTAASTTQTVTVSTGGTYTVTVVDANGCEAITSVDIFYNPLPTPTIIVTETSGTANDDGILCDGDIATLDVGTFSLYQWSTLEATQTIDVTTAGTYTATVTDANGCVATAETTITINPLPVLTDPNIIVCSNEASAYDLTQHDLTVGAGTVTWYDDNPTTTGVAIADPTVVDLTTNPDLWAELVDINNCSEIIDVSLTLNTPPTIGITGDLSYCQGESTTLSATDDPTYTYLWSDMAATTTLDLVVNAPGDYTVTVTDANNCTGTATVNVTELTLPTATVVADNADACEGDVITFTFTGTPSAQVTYDDGGLVPPAPIFLDPATGTATINIVAGTADVTVTLISITDGNCSQALTDSATTPVSLPSDAGTDGTLTICGNGEANTALDLMTGLGGTPEMGGSWNDDTGAGVDLTDPANVDFNGIAAGNYDFTYTVAGTTPCPDAAATVTVTVVDAPTVVVDSTTCEPDLLNYNAHVTALTGTVSSDVGTVVDNGGGSYTITDIPANTTATITVLDGNGCQTSITAFDECPCPVLNDPVNDGDMSMCDGATIPTLSVTVDPVGLSANWYDAAVGGTLLASTSITYTPDAALLSIGDNFFYAEVIDPVSGCIGNRVEVNLIVNANPTANPAILTVCDDNTDGFAAFTLAAADATVLAGQTGMTVTYHVLPGDAANGTNALGATYTNVLANAQTISVRVEDANGCFTTNTIDLVVEPLPVFTIELTETSGATDNDGDICEGDMANLSVSVAGLTYEWSDGLGTDQAIDVTPLVTTTYTVTVTELNGCTASAEATVVVNPLPTATVSILETSGTTDDDGVICEGDDAVLAVAETGVNYSWSTGDLAQAITVTPLVTTDFTVTVTDIEGCSSTSMVTVVVNPLPTPVIAVTETSGTTADDGILCQGDAAVLDAGVFDSYLWSDAAASTTQTITVTDAGTYTVTTTDANGCVGTAEVTIVVNPLPNEVITVTETSGIADDDGILCDGDDAVLDAGAGFVSYLWSDAAASTTQTITVNTPGTYSVTCVDANGCQASTSIDIFYNPLPAPVITVTETSGTTDDDGILCDGDAAVLDAGIFDSYLWSDAGASTTQTITVTTAGVYTVTTTDANGCAGTAEIIITVNPLPNEVITITETSGVAADDGILCEGDDAVLDAGIFVAYTWSTGETTQTITVSTAGNYAVTCMDSNGCEASTNVDIFVNPLPTPVITVTETSGTTADDGILCDGDAATLDAGVFDSYLWSDAGASTTQTITVTDAGTYTVTVTDANGCQATASFDIFVNPLPLPVITVTDASGTTADDGILCIGDAATLDAGVFDSYLWSDVTASTTATITVTDPGTYTVTVTDANNCQATASFDILVNPLPAPIIAVTETSGVAVDDGILCLGDNATLDAGIFDAYQWSDGLGNAQNIVVAPLVTTTYTVTVTDANGCEATAETTVTVNPLPSTAITITETSGAADDDGILCEGDAATLTADLATSYLWSDGAQTTQSITVTTTGAYTVTITDVNGCVATAEAVIIVNPLPTPVIGVIETSGATANDGILCEGDDATLDAGVFSSYQWSVGAATSATITVNAAGTYTVTVTDANGCQATAETTIATTPLPTPTIAISETSGHTDNDGLLCAGDVATLDAGTFDSYQWSLGGATTQTITVNTTGDYTVTVTDGNGCEATSTVFISINPIPVPAISGDFEFCEGTSTVLTATPGYVSYAWSPAGTAASLTVTQPGDYTVTVTDDNGCTGEATVTVTTVPNPEPFIVGDNIVCAGSTTTIDVGAGYAAYNWSDGSVTQTITVGAGTHTVTVTDINGCFGVTSFNVAEEPALDIQIEEPDRLTCEVQAVTLDASATANASSFEWTTINGIIDSGASTATPTVSQPGVYTVTVFSSSDLECPTSADVTVIANPLTITDIYVSIDSLVCYGDSSAIITIDSIEGGVEPYLYQMDTSAFTGQTAYPGLMAGEYVLTVMDAEGCEFSETVTVTQPPLVTLDLFPVDTTIHLGDSVQLEAFVNPLIPLSDTTWTQTNWLSCTDCLDPVASPLQTTMYELIVTDTSGCMAIDTALVRVENNENIYIPNSFTPNNDGANDVFMIYGGIGVTRVKTFVIFDRWGEQMFSKTNFQPNSPEHGWDGTFNGKPMRPAVFVYYAEIEFDNGRTRIFKGDVTLISSAR